MTPAELAGRTYYVVVEDVMGDLEREVESLIEAGWVPSGAPFVLGFGSEYAYWYQAMVRVPTKKDRAINEPVEAFTRVAQ